jgi:Na+-driven multidrug efflux pump
VQETFVLAIFFFVGKGIQSKQGPGSQIKTSLTMILLFSIVLAGILFSLSSHFVAIIGTPETIREATSTFLKIKTAGIPIFLLSAASIIIVETVNRKKLILTLAILQVVYRFVLDSLFYGGYSFSLNIGVLGVAWSDTLASLALLITALILIRPLALEKLKNWRSLFSFQDWRVYLKVGAWSGLDSLVRNVAYFFMIVRLLNLLGENHIGGYYLAMHIFWSFLLVPILALSESSKVLIANNSANIAKVRTLWYSSLVIGGVVVLFWLAFLPFWRNFAGFLNSNSQVVNLSTDAMSILIIPYIMFALNTVTDSIFYGVGKTQYQAYQAIITNGTVYVVAFVAYLTGLWAPTFTSILILFGIGILVDSILTVFYAFRVLFPKRSSTLKTLQETGKANF